MGCGPPRINFDRVAELDYRRLVLPYLEVLFSALEIAKLSLDRICGTGNQNRRGNQQQKERRFIMTHVGLPDCNSDIQTTSSGLVTGVRVPPSQTADRPFLPESMMGDRPTDSDTFLKPSVGVRTTSFYIYDLLCGIRLAG
jgi:hypothetical protein